MSDNDYKLIRYMHPNMGEHRVIGPVTKNDYGYRGGGQEFLVHVSDIQNNPSLFHDISVESINPVIDQTIQRIPPPELVAEVEAVSKVDEPLVPPEIAKRDKKTRKARTPRTKK